MPLSEKKNIVKNGDIDKRELFKCLKLKTLMHNNAYKCI